MGICRYCNEVIGEQDEICGNCGYNPGSDTMTTAFVKKKTKTVTGGKQKILSPGVKSFAFWGLAIVVLSLGIKYQGKFGDIVWKARNILLGNKVNKSAQALEKSNQKKRIKLMDVRSSKVPTNKSTGQQKRVEGIFFDPQGKSYVVINGQLVSEQMSFENMMIKKINRDSVEVIQDGQKRVLTVSK